MIPSRQVQPGQRHEYVRKILVAEEQGLGLVEPALPDAQHGQRPTGARLVQHHRPVIVLYCLRQHRLGLAPPADVGEHRAVRGVAVGREDHRIVRGERALFLERAHPRLGTADVTGPLAGAHQAARHLRERGRVAQRAADPQRHRLVDPAHSLAEQPLGDKGDAAVAEGTCLEIRVAEPPGDVQCLQRACLQLVQVRDRAADLGRQHPAPLDAHPALVDQPPRPGEPATRGDPVAEAVHPRRRRPGGRHRRRSRSVLCLESGDCGLEMPGRAGKVAEDELQHSPP